MARRAPYPMVTTMTLLAGQNTKLCEGDSKHLLDDERGLAEQAEIDAREVFSNDSKHAKLNARKQ